MNGQVEAQADRVRDELLQSLRELDRRFKTATDFRLQVQRHASALIGAGVAALLAVGAGVGLAIYRRKTAAARLRHQRFAGLLRAWQHPERLARTKKTQRPVGAELLRRVLLTAATTLTAQATRYFAGQSIPRRGAASRRLVD